MRGTRSRLPHHLPRRQEFLPDGFVLLLSFPRKLESGFVISWAIASATDRDLTFLLCAAPMIV